MSDWLSEYEDDLKFDYTLDTDVSRRMARVIREFAASGPLLQNIYTSMFVSEGRNEGLPPQVQYWLQEIPKFLDNLSPDAKEVIKEC